MRTAMLRTLLPAVVLAAFALAGCKPKYPKCETDEHCAEKGEVCINGACQECGDNAQCETKHGAGHECVGGRCEVKPECRVDGDCSAVGASLVCRSNKCVPECTQTTDCAGGLKCEAQKCVAECSTDVECGPGRTCVNGACAQTDTNALKISAQCRPMGTTQGEVVSLQTVRFDFDQFDLTVDARQSLEQSVGCLKQAPTSLKIILEGHADDRGTQEYNLALAEKRANAVRAYLKNLGIDAVRMETRSYGENKPLCSDETEACWSKNRRVEFIQILSAGM